MKKTSIILIIILLTGTAVGLTGSSKDDALNQLRNHKNNKNIDTENILKTLTLTTDKMCHINYNSEEIICTACYSFTYQGNKHENCVILKPDTTEEEDLNKIRNKARKQANNLYSRIEANYKERTMQGTKP